MQRNSHESFSAKCAKWIFWAATAWFALMLVGIAGSAFINYRHSLFEHQQRKLVALIFAETWDELASLSHQPQPVWDVADVVKALKKHNGAVPIEQFLVFQTKSDTEKLIVYEGGPSISNVVALLRGGDQFPWAKT